jgi:hypothetical protein
VVIFCYIAADATTNSLPFLKAVDPIVLATTFASFSLMGHA